MDWPPGRRSCWCIVHSPSPAFVGHPTRARAGIPTSERPRDERGGQMSATARAAEAARARPRWRQSVWGELSAEFLGTFVLICFGDGVVAMAVAALNQSGRGTAIFAASGDWLLITWGWAMAVTFGVYVAGGISGAHINPAVTLALAVRRTFPWAKVVP